MFPVTITIHNSAQLDAVLASLYGVQLPAAQQDACLEKKPRATSAKTTAATVHTATTAEAGAGDAPESKGENSAQAADAGNGQQVADAAQPASPDEAPTYKRAADAITALAKVKGRDAAVSVLAQFAATKLTDVKPEQFADVIAACEKAGV